MVIEVLQSSTAVAGLVFLASVCLAVFMRNRQLDSHARRGGFAPPTRYRLLEPFMGLDYFVKIFGDVSNVHRDRLRYGKTFMIQPWISETCIVTSEPENIQKIFGSVDNDYSVNWRRKPFVPFTGRGILTEDGDGWRAPRKLYRPAFAKNIVGNLDYLGKIVDDLVERISEVGTLDLQPLLSEAFMKNALHSTLGCDAWNPHEGQPLSQDQFMSIWSDGMQGVAMRLLTGSLSGLIPMKRFRQSCIKVHDFVEFYMKRAASLDIKEAKSQVAVDMLLAQIDDRDTIRNMLVQAIIGAQDTTSVLVSNTIRLLARHPAFWKEIREEVLKHGRDIFTFDVLRSNEVIQNALMESLRLYPAFPILDRVAVRDTILPTGGGPSSTSPIMVKAGSHVHTSFYSLQREPSIYGADVEEFNPHRWKFIKPGQWEFMAFGGGPRNCMGREKSLVEAGYLLAKLATRFEKLQSKDDREWVGVLGFTCTSKYGCVVAFE